MPELFPMRPQAFSQQRSAFRQHAARLQVAVGLALLLVLVALGSTPALAAALPPGGEQLFVQHCSGCHINGGNIIRRGKTLRLAALQRQGIEGPEAIAAIAASGIGQMGGYAAVLGEDGPAAVADYVWQQALAGWPAQKA